MERSWKMRRIAVFSTLILCDALLVYLVVWGEDTSLNRDLANGLLLLLAAVINGYMGFASWDDKLKGKEQLQMKQAEATPND